MNKERERYILEQLLKKKTITVKELAKELYASEPSIRRDLQSLERQNLIKRVHGGAILEETALSKNKIPFLLRELEQSDAKIVMAKKAIELVNDNDVIFLDASTSAYNLVPYLLSKRNLTVITNGVKALSLLGEYGINAVSTGGTLVPSCMVLVGEEAYASIERINADVAFFSCRGLSDEGYLTDIAPAENYVRMKMIQNARNAYLLCAGDKIGKKYFHNLCTVRDITGIISEVDISDRFDQDSELSNRNNSAGI